jgi:hypothetical protein
MFEAHFEQGGNFGKIEMLRFRDLRLSKDDVAAYATAKSPVQFAALILLALSDVDC